jgi:starch phosphorylase
MKVLVNGGLNCSIRDGWWDEAYEPDVGWAIGDGTGGEAKQVDRRDAQSLYDILEQNIVPEFYDRDVHGLPRAWLARIRRSMSVLTPAFGSTRMVREYVEKAYLPLAASFRARIADDCAGAKAAYAWANHLQRHWSGLHIGSPTVVRTDGDWRFSVPIILGENSPGSVHVELFADAAKEMRAEVIALHQEQAIAGTLNGYIYAGEVAKTRPAEDYTIRVIPYHEGVHVPGELPLIIWQR